MAKTATAPQQAPLVIDIETAPRGSTVPIPAPPATDVMAVIERVASNPDADIAKLERLIDLKRSIDADHARSEFYAAFAAMQGDLPLIDEHGAIKVDGNVRSRYAKYEDIQAAIRPVLQKHGFSLRHRNEVVGNNQLRIVGILSHRAGHFEQDEFICPPDKSGGKAEIQAIGSTRSYGARYTTIALLNIETRGLDDDGRKAATLEREPVPTPDGYKTWRDDMEAAADEGTPVLMAAFNQSKKEYRKLLTSSGEWEQFKATAATKTAGGR